MVAEKAADMIIGKEALSSIDAPVWIHPRIRLTKQR